MCQSDQLTAWLQHPIYADGVLLYAQLIGEDFWFRQFRKSSDDYNRVQLQTALEKKLDQLQIEEAARKAAYPESLKNALTGGGGLMDERTILKERMRALYNGGVTDSEELKAMAFRILAIKDELDRVYGRKHFFEQHGFLPEAATFLPETISPTDLLKRRNTVRTYVTKYTAQEKITFDPIALKKVQHKLQQFQTELADLDNQLSQAAQH